MSWLRNLKVGDTFLDSTRICVGEILEIKHDCVIISWYLDDRPVMQRIKVPFSREPDLDWFLLTPLTKELL